MGVLDGRAPGAGDVGERPHPEMLRVGAFLSFAEVTRSVVSSRMRERSLAIRERTDVLWV
jgi:hypothetical protein